MRTGRRTMLKMAVAAGAAPTLAGAANNARITEDDPANIKLSHRIPATASDDDLHFLQQIGLKWARVEFGDMDPSLDGLAGVQKRFSRYGMKIYSGVHYAYRSLKVQLGQEGRDRDIETYRTFLKNLGKLGVPLSNYDFHPGNTYTTAEVMRPRGYEARQFDLNDFRNKVEKQRFDREYSAEEIWNYYTYFVRAVQPVADEAKVTLALHPDDPPLQKMNGVAKVFTHYEGYRRAEELAGKSRYWGLTFCVGTWSEGGTKMGKDVFEMIRDFGGRGRIADVHFRNVTGPLPHFDETFPDEGYLDMYAVMRDLRKVKFSGTVVPDHVPKLVGDTGIRRAGTAYCIAYMRALLERANAEVG